LLLWRRALVLKTDNDTKRKENFRPIVGIDLGTTNSAVAYIRHGKPKIISSPSGEELIPSVVLIDTSGEVIVGKDAVAALVAMPSRTIAAIKRKMGSSDFIDIAEQKLLPHEISSLILKELKSYLDNILGEGEIEAVITVPAYFTDEQRRATKKAGELAGFIVERIINEPTAAALAFGFEHLNEDNHILVYDLGGGTFDVSVVEMMGGILEVKASTGNNYLGGEDFDWKLVDLFAQNMIDKHKIDPRNDLRGRALLKEEAEKTKILLSTRESIKVSLPIVTVKGDQPIGLEMTVYREEFIKLIDEMLLETMQSVQTVLKDSNLSRDDIDEILLVGGSTHIPRVTELIEDFFQKEPRMDIDPEEAVVLGAAVQAGIKSGVLAKDGLIVTDVAPYSMGIAVLMGWHGFAARSGGFHAIIDKNTTVPVTRSEIFSTCSDDQNAVSIEIFQGENEWSKKNHALGKFLLAGIPPNQAGEEKIKVTFRYNINGILEVSAECVSTGENMTVTVQDALERDSEEDYLDSFNRVQDLLKKAAESTDDEDDEWEGFQMMMNEMLEEMEDEDEELSLEELVEEVTALRENAKGMMKTARGKKRRLLRQVDSMLSKATLKSNIEELQTVINKATDILIDLESEEI